MTLISSTKATKTSIIGLNFDRFFAPPVVAGIGTPVLMDKDQDAQITLADGAALKELYLFTEANAILGFQLAENEVEISTAELEEGSVVEIDNVVIGTITQYDGRSIVIEFVTTTLPEEVEALRIAVEKLIRALTFTNLDTDSASPERRLSLVITDSLDNADDAQVYMADRFLGDGDSNVIEIDNEDISWGDEIDGGGGEDTLQLLTDGEADFIWLSKFEGIEIVLGTNAVDTIYMTNSQVRKLTRIDGGGQSGDRLHVEGSTVDLTGIEIGGISSITYDGVGTTILVDNVSVANMLQDKYRVVYETLTIAAGALTDAERLALHRKGIDNIVHDGRKTTIADFGGAGPTTPTTPTTSAVDKPLMLTGTSGKDALTGAGGADTLNGGTGNDVLTGNGGTDHFVFDTALGKGTTAKNQNKKVNFDTITDFKPGEDKILLDNAIFKKLGKGSADAPSALNKSVFKKNKATDKDDFLVYKGGVLSYDADGNGTKHKPVEISKIANKANLSAADFFVI